MNGRIVALNCPGVPSPRSGNSAVLIENDDSTRMLVYGGISSEGYRGDIHCFTLKREEKGDFTGEWSSIEVEGLKPFARAYTQMVVVGKWVYMFGGICNGFNFRNDLWKLDSETFTWTRIGPPLPPDPENETETDENIWPAGRCSYSMNLYQGNKLVLYGGLAHGYTFLDDLWIYHIDEGRWECVQCEGSFGCRSGHTSHIYGNQLVVMGGKTREKYLNHLQVCDLESRVWRHVELAAEDQDSLPQPASGRFFAPVTPTCLALCGGVDQSSIHSNVYLLNLGNDYFA
eukprot:TRINITY_DN3670_c0_g1_i2.p1 TRINITY_DN3670_c0_g1~~TRINITY_DN3670_c0_g1_i2.p1  ORF type:complete len:306 (-),score=32.53 TRINITY_DN3670_c0_g1_i2:91-951(-)